MQTQMQVALCANVMQQISQQLVWLKPCNNIAYNTDKRKPLSIYFRNLQCDCGETRPMCLGSKYVKENMKSRHTVQAQHSHLPPHSLLNSSSLRSWGQGFAVLRSEQREEGRRQDKFMRAKQTQVQFSIVTQLLCSVNSTETQEKASQAVQRAAA